MTDGRPGWVVIRSAKLGFSLGIGWLLFGLLSLLNFGSRTGPLHWIAAVLGFFLGSAYLASAWWLRHHSQS